MERLRGDKAKGRNVINNLICEYCERSLMASGRETCNSEFIGGVVVADESAWWVI